MVIAARSDNGDDSRMASTRPRRIVILAFPGAQLEPGGFHPEGSSRGNQNQAGYPATPHGSLDQERQPSARPSDNFQRRHFASPHDFHDHRHDNDDRPRPGRARQRQR